MSPTNRRSIGGCPQRRPQPVEKPVENGAVHRVVPTLWKTLWKTGLEQRGRTRRAERCHDECPGLDGASAAGRRTAQRASPVTGERTRVRAHYARMHNAMRGPRAERGIRARWTQSRPTPHLRMGYSVWGVPMGPTRKRGPRRGPRFRGAHQISASRSRMSSSST